MSKREINYVWNSPSTNIIKVRRSNELDEANDAKLISQLSNPLLSQKDLNPRKPRLYTKAWELTVSNAAKHLKSNNVEVKSHSQGQHKDWDLLVFYAQSPPCVWPCYLKNFTAKSSQWGRWKIIGRQNIYVICLEFLHNFRKFLYNICCLASFSWFLILGFVLNFRS